MKVRLTFKDPDGVADSITEAAKESLDGMLLSPEESEDVFEMRRKSIEKACEKWVEYGEYLTVEIDTEAGTATVVEV